MNREKDAALLHEVLDTAQTHLGITGEVITGISEVEKESCDFRVRLKIGGRIVDALVEVRATLNDAVVGTLMARLGNRFNQILVATRYVPAPLGERMKALGVQFIDTAGNAFIDRPPVLVYALGRKRPLPPPTTSYEVAWSRAGLKVVFALLCNAHLEQRAYRDIAASANVALGTVAGSCDDLRKQGFLIVHGGEGRRLIRKKELLDRWTIAYAERIRPRTLLGRYSSTGREKWPDNDLLREGAWLGGEAAGAMLTLYLKPQTITFYAERPIQKLVFELRLRQDPMGDVEVRERFWRFETPGEEKRIAPHVLIYADLLATGDSRNIETAKVLYDKYIRGSFGED